MPFVGLREANRALRSLPARVTPGVQAVMDTTGYRVSSRASSAAARRTGYLAKNIGWQSRPRTLAAVVGVNKGTAYYWKFVEYGTKTMDAQPLLRPAAQAEESQHAKALVAALERATAEMEQSAGSFSSRLL